MVDNTERGIGMDLLRSIFAGIDRVVYNLLAAVYQIFYNVATADFLSGQTIKEFYSRIQLILGIIIMFKVAISLFNGILNPDSFNNEKNGFGSIIKRIVMVLVMLMLLVPLNIPGVSSSDIEEGGQKSWNARMNQNGILFGTIYELQSRLLSQNTISRLILGTDDPFLEEDDDDFFGTGDNQYKKAANDLATIVLRCFITINLNKENGNPEDEDDLMCKEEKLEKYNKSYSVYESSNSTTSQILSEINQMCDNETGYGGERYAYNYSYVFSTVVGVLCVLIIVSFTVDAAIRVFKLAILRLIAPIPILSYIDPKTQSTFQNWVKTVGKTFLSLFVRLAIINFVIFFIREISQNGFGLKIEGSGVVGLFSKIFVILGLLFFAKEAPKFITDTLGIKSDGKLGLFSGLGRLRAAGSLAAGTVGSAVTNWRAFRGEHEKNENGGFKAGASNFFRRGVGAAGSALIGGVSGFASGANALSGADKDFNANVMKAMQARNAQRASHSTFLGRFADRQSQLWTGQSLATRDSDALEAAKNAATQLKNVKAMKEEEAMKNGYYGVYKDSNGDHYLNVADLEARLKNPDQNGKITIKDVITGKDVTFDAATFNANVLSKVKDSQVTNWENGITAPGATTYADNGKLQTAITELTAAIKKADLVGENQKVKDVIAYDNLGKAIGEANKLVASMNTEMKHIKHMANKQSNDKK